ncbi:ABC transporter substrate-binding protein [Microbacterium betulae]|uniref:ABC transporter substrate-binding protein n=1 Tax=Microbacterium betulae TaxID=2981139 RepID=A0AA97FG09_9MICO|nr:ABC transporter substrate-binding protein [Microbacterium sp. AB]WOF21978.1 ABC transporter substrate-binding protein [Microbacterium sp. AB]
MRPQRSPRAAHRLGTAAAAVAVASLLLTACGAGGSADDAGEAGAEGIRVAVTDPGQLIPGRQTVAFDFNMAVWSPLTFIQNDGTMDYVAAESIESDDQRTWTVTLRDGFTFHDGTPVTAQDYVDAWNHVAYGPNAFENAGLLVGIEGYEDLNPAGGEPTATEMSGLTVNDDLSFTVALTVPDGQFPVQLSQAQTAFYPMPQSAYDDMDAYNRHPIGNGPFQMEGDYVEAEPITVTAYEDFTGDEPTVDEIEFVPYTDTATAYNDVLAGNIDVASVPANRLAQAPDDFGDRLYRFEAPGIAFLGLPLWDERYQDIRVRQAISMAIDRETINGVIYGGGNLPATAWTPAIEPGTPEGICGAYCEYDPEAATALLDEAGGFDGTIDILYPGGSGLDELYTAIANNLRQNLGVEAVATPSSDWAEFLERRTEADVSGPFFSRWGALYPSQQATLRVFFLEGGGCANCIPWYSDDVAAAMQAADADPSTDGSAYVAVQELIQAEFPAVPLFFETYSYVTSDRVADLVNSPVGNPTYKDIVLVD